MSEKEAEARLLALAEKIKATLTSELRVELEACKDELRAERDKEGVAMVKPDQDAAPKPKEEVVRVEVTAGTRTSGDVSSQNETGTRRACVPAILPTVPAILPTISAPELHTQLTQKRPLKATMWDAALLVKTQDVRLASSALILLLVGVTAILQLGLIWALFYPDIGLTKMHYNEAVVEGLIDWRRTVAHDIAFYSSRDGTLASRVCRSDSSLQYSSSQLSTNTELSNYLGDFEDGGTRSFGVLVCSLSMLLWLTTIMEEVDDVYTLLHAIAGVPRGSTVISLASDDGGIHAMSSGRCFYVGFVLACRAIVAVLLLVAGALFLA